MAYEKITIVVDSIWLEEVETSLRELAVPGMTISNVRGYGRYRNFFRPDWTGTHARFEVFADEADTERILERLNQALPSDGPRSGFVAVEPVEIIRHFGSDDPKSSPPAP